MTQKILRGRVLSFTACPKNADDHAAYTYVEDGALCLENGQIVAMGAFDEMPQDVPVTDHRPHLLMAGFIDTHNHFVQMQVIGSYGAQLLDWLENYTFPAETKFNDPDHSARIATQYFDEMLRHGTTTPVAYCSVHKTSAEAYFNAAAARNIRAIGGKVLMDRNAPDGLLDTPQTGYDDSVDLIGKWHGTGRALYAISPRFAITSTPAQLEAAQALVAENPDCYMQTHLSENRDEIAATMSLYPEHLDYLGIYEHYGLLGPRSLLGHAIHLSDREISVMAETGSVAVFCPTSNLFIGSGLFDHARIQNADIPVAIATDIGGGTSYSMLRTLDEAYKVCQLKGQNLSPLYAFYLITLGNAKALGLNDKIGTLDAGTEADIVVLNANATQAMRLRMETVETLSEELFVLQTLGDDRAIVETYVAGRSVKPV
ncbi:MAG: guanine deaminase [Paracoccaceae bacterium]